MITDQSYSEEWIEQVLTDYRSTNYGLAEKMIYAFTLLEQLARHKLRFIFKGGTSLALLMPTLHRFSKDLDILMEQRPDNLEQILDELVENSPFTRWEESLREPEFDVPKEHFKFYYNLSRPRRFKEEPILLDILFGESSYPAVQQLTIQHTILNTEEPYSEISLPTIEGITGDKLTAFAPQTLGIPFGKNKAVEIMKQLFDLHQL
ncbi:MAG: nucleotidyl transferase AbiEii/AbiGii toxin family protein, partial [Salibacteraceae bacterium]